jgi:flagellar basal-body rod protein FlgF
MDPISVLAASGIRARMQSLDLLANNLANAATNGYKIDGEFYSLFTSGEADGGDDVNPPTMPALDQHWTDFSQGLLQNTGNPLDVALSGPGFFVANGPAGPLYTRNGSFQISASGTLITADGYPVRTQGGGAITVNPTSPVDITPEGTVQQKGQAIGQLDIVSFADTTVLAKQGSNYYRNISEKATASPATGVEVRQGQIEASNVKTADAAVRLVGVMRQFEMLQKAITMAMDMNRQGIQEVARIP